MGKIVRDKRYDNTIWCLCNDYEEYLQFAKDLFLFTGISDPWGGEYEDERWLDECSWSNLFDVDFKEWEDDEEDCLYEEAVDPINDTYVIKEKPNEDEYPVVIFCNHIIHPYGANRDDTYIYWASLNKLKDKELNL